MGSSSTTLSAAEQRDILSTATVAVASYASSFSNKIGNRHFFSNEDIEDLIQNTAMNAWRAIGTYDPTKAKFNTWVSTIAMHCVADAIRYRGRHAPISYSPTVKDKDKDEDDETTVGEACDSRKGFNTEMTELFNEFSADGCADRHDFERHVWETVATLSEEEQRRFRLIYDGFAPKEIALIEGCSRGDAATRCCRLRKKLKKLL